MIDLTMPGHPDGKAADSGRSLATPLGPESAPSETRADRSMTTALDPLLPFRINPMNGRKARKRSSAERVGCSTTAHCLAAAFSNIDWGAGFADFNP
jgi:hypothetical protein